MEKEACEVLEKKHEDVGGTSLLCIWIGMYIMDWVVTFFFQLVTDIELETMKNCTVEPIKYFIPLLVYVCLVFVAAWALAIPNRNQKKNLIMAFVIIFLYWLVYVGIDFLLHREIVSMLFGSRAALFSHVRIFGSVFISWLCTLPMLLCVGGSVYAAVAIKRHWVMKGKRVLQTFWWTNGDGLPCMFTDDGAYFWDSEEKQYKFAIYKDKSFGKE